MKSFTPYSKGKTTVHSRSFISESRKTPSRLQHYTDSSKISSKSVAKQYYSFVGRTLAEENLHGFSFKGPKQRGDPSLDPYSPQRIELPLYFNTPKRKDDLVDIRKYRVKHETEGVKATSYINNPSALNMSYADSTERLIFKKRLKDYNLLAFACKRANKMRDEGRAYYSQGVLYDNLGNYIKAVVCYQQFLNVCKKIGDTHGEALAYNCMGVAYQKLGGKDPKYYKLSLESHMKHNQIGDIAGKFIASVNLGMVYNLLGESDKAAMHHQSALKHAVQMSSIAGQTIAVGNLGHINAAGTLIQDKKKLMAFVQRYLELSSELSHKKGEMSAYLQLGIIEKEQGDYKKSVQHFKKARALAKENGDNETEQEASVNYGIVHAELKWEEAMKNVLSKAKLDSTFG